MPVYLHPAFLFSCISVLKSEDIRLLVILEPCCTQTSFRVTDTARTARFNYKLRDGVVVRAFASQSVDLGFIPLVESYQKTLKNGIRSFPAWRSAFRGGCGKQAGKLACCVLGQGT